MKVTLTFKVSIEVEDPTGYPDEFNRITDPKTKRERQVVTAHRRAVKAAEDVIIEALDDIGLDAERVGG